MTDPADDDYSMSTRGVEMTSRMTKWRVAAVLRSVALGSVVTLTTVGVAQANPANLDWWGATDGAGDQILLGNPSDGGGYHGNIHSFAAAGSKCLDANLDDLT
jgi:hypothetical protein